MAIPDQMFASPYSASDNWNEKLYQGIPGEKRERLLTFLLQERRVLRMLVAPCGMGKTSLMADYARTVFGLERTRWIDGGSSGFLTGLDDGFEERLVASCAKRGSLLVIDDLPHLDEERTTRLSAAIDAIIEGGWEVLVGSVPSNDSLSSLQADCLTLDSNMMLLREDERRMVLRSRTDGTAVALQNALGIPVYFARGLDKGYASCLEGFLDEDLPLRFHQAAIAMAFLGNGSRQDLHSLGITLASDEEDFLSKGYLFLGFDKLSGRFKSPTIPIQVLVSILNQRGGIDRYGILPEQLFVIIRALLHRRGHPRCLSILHSFCSDEMKLAWLDGTCPDLIDLGCAPLADEVMKTIPSRDIWADRPEYCGTLACFALANGDVVKADDCIRTAVGVIRREGLVTCCTSEGLVRFRRAAFALQLLPRRDDPPSGSGGQEDAYQPLDAIAGLVASSQGPMGYLMATAMLFRKVKGRLGIFTQSNHRERGVSDFVDGRVPSASSSGRATLGTIDIQVRGGMGLPGKDHVPDVPSIYENGRYVEKGLFLRERIVEALGRIDGTDCDAWHFRLTLHLLAETLRCDGPPRAEMPVEGRSAGAPPFDAPIGARLRPMLMDVMGRVHGSTSLTLTEALIVQDVESLDALMPSNRIDAIRPTELRSHAIGALGASKGIDIVLFPDDAERLWSRIAREGTADVAAHRDGGTPTIAGDSGIPHVSIRIFGGFEVLVDDVPVDTTRWNRRKARWLLALLLLNLGKDVPREQILRVLWPGSAGVRMNDSLYASWSTLRLLMCEATGLRECPYLRKSGTLYRVDGRYLSADVFEYEELSKRLIMVPEDSPMHRHVNPPIRHKASDRSCHQWLELFLRLEEVYRGELLADRHVDDYFASCRQKYWNRTIELLIRGSNYAISIGNSGVSAWFAQRAMEYGGEREETYRALIRAQMADGQRTAALETYEKCRLFMRSAMGLNPSAKTEVLYQDLICEDECSLDEIVRPWSTRAISSPPQDNEGDDGEETRDREGQRHPTISDRVEHAVGDVGDGVGREGRGHVPRPGEGASASEEAPDASIGRVTAPQGDAPDEREGSGLNAGASRGDVGGYDEAGSPSRGRGNVLSGSEDDSPYDGRGEDGGIPPSDGCGDGGRM